MSDHTEDSLQTDALEAEVAELLDEVEKKAVAVEARLGAGDDPEVNELLDEVGAASAAAAALDQDVDALIAEAERQVAPESERDEEVEALIEAVASEADPTTSDAAPEPAADAVADREPEPEPAPTAESETVAAPAPEAEAVHEPDAGAEVEADPVAVAPVDEPAVEASDAELVVEDAGDVPEAPGADESSPAPLGEVMDPTDEIDLSAPAPPAKPDSPAETGALDDELAAEADDAIGSEIAGEVETVDLGEALAAHDTEVAEVAEAAAPPPEEVAATATTEPVESAAQEPAAPARWLMLLAAAATGLRLLSSPMERLSVRQRDTVGWVAINLAFIAFCVWLYTLLR